MRRWLALALLTLVWLGVPSGHAATNPDEILGDPALEERARGLSKPVQGTARRLPTDRARRPLAVPGAPLYSDPCFPPPVRPP